MFSYLLLRFLVFVFSMLSFRTLHKIADGIAFLLYKILHYRYGVIFTNLKNSFPEKTNTEILSIIEDTYRNLGDVIVETIKGMTLQLPEIERRYYFKNPEVANEIFGKNKSAIGLVSHYNNWEWGAYTAGSQLNSQVVGVFKPLRNRRMNDFLHKVRSRYGAQIISMDQTAKALVANRDTPSLFVLIADQNPSNLKHVHWINFFNQETACFDGPERIARKTNYPVLYFAIERMKRGFYEIEISMLCENPSLSEPGEITRLYMEKLERQIRRKPENWLWSHRRWKHKRVLEGKH